MAYPGHRSSMKSKRLQKVLGVFRAAARQGVTIASINAAANITSGKDVVYELRRNGIEITSQWVQSRVGARYKRYWLTELAPAA